MSNVIFSDRPGIISDTEAETGRKWHILQVSRMAEHVDLSEKTLKSLFYSTELFSQFECFLIQILQNLTVDI